VGGSQRHGRGSTAAPHPSRQVRAAFAAVRDASFVDIDASRGVDEVAAAVLSEATEAVRRCSEGQPVLALWDYTPLPAQGASL
jgi:hypothetical protein